MSASYPTLEETFKEQGWRLRTNQLVVFKIEEHRYALPLVAVERVVRAVEVTPLPKGPEIILGLLNVQGRILPAINLRRRFRLPEQELDPSHQFIIAQKSKRNVALVVDEVTGVVEPSEKEVVPAEEVLSKIEYIQGVVKRHEGLIFILDLDTIFPFEEEKALDNVMREKVGGNQ
jgi:purine-binding chemotaxis protein CheW